MIGANREAVNRAMRDLREKGTVDVVEHRIHLRDRQALEREAQARPAVQSSPTRVG
jgi:CRP-like cAMP-binding protein